MQKIGAVLFQTLVIVLVTFALLEGGMALLLHHPRLLQSPLVPWQLGTLAQKYYLRKDRPIIQYMPACARYDTDLFYTLKPGSCRFASREFDVVIDVNDQGLRGAHIPPNPAIAVIGDSQAMGWGVPGDRIFSSRLEQALGSRVANIAVSSYGTAREMLMLRRLDLSTPAIVITYNANDEEENAAFVTAGGHLPPRTQAEYDTIAASETKRHAYFPGRHILNLAGWLGDIWAARQPQSHQPTPAPGGGESPEDHAAALFLKTLAFFPDQLQGRRVLVIEVNESYNDNTGRFVAALQRHIAAGKARSLPCTLEPIDLRPGFRPDHFYFLDGHMNERGHAYVAQVLLDRLHQAPPAARTTDGNTP